MHRIKDLKTEDWFHPDGFPLAIERREPQQPFGMHTHEFWEVVLVTAGTGWHVSGEDSWRLTAGDVFVIGGSRPHDYVDLDQLSLINLLFMPSLLTQRLQDLPAIPGYQALFHLEPNCRKDHQFNSRLKISVAELEHAINLVDSIEAVLAERQDGFAFEATAHFDLLVIHLSRCYGRSQAADSHSLMRVAEAVAYLERNYAQPISLDDLAEIAKLSRRSFLRAFESAMHRTPISHLISLRIQRAAELLRTTNLSITDIAFQVGFNDSNYFSRQFRRVTGDSPRSYRQRSNNRY